MPKIETQITIKCPLNNAYSQAKKQEEFPGFMNDIRSVKILSAQNNSHITEWEATIDGVSLMWTEEDTFDDDKHTISFIMIEGDLEIYEGIWTFEKIDNTPQTLSKLTIVYDFGLSSLTDLIGPTLEEKVLQNANMMLDGIKSKCESI